MLELSTFGGVALARDGTVIPWTLRGWQRAALLALLGASRKRGISRALLASTLWPRADEGAARHSLDELLSRTRRELDERELFVGSTTIAFNSAVIATDVADFESAIAASRLDAAARLYRGPFADALRTLDSPPLETRITALRAHFATEFRQVAESLANAAERRGDCVVAARWWEKVVAVEPDSSAAVVRFVELLAAAGELERALSVARARVKRDAMDGHVADPALGALVARLKAGGVRPGGDGRLPPPPPPPGLPPPDRASLIARVVGSEYRVGGLLSDRTMELVYEGVATETGAQVELRLLQPRVAAGVDPAHFAEVMGRAIRVLHPGVLPTLAVRATHDALVTITARRPPEHLKGRMRQGAGAVDEVVRTGMQMALALDAVHAVQLVHGILRPRLVALARSGPLLCSTGLGQLLLDRQVADDRSTVVSVGKPRYQSPEQLVGTDPLSVSSDIYSLGAILHEWLIGYPSFPETAEGALQKLRERPPSVRAVRVAVPLALDELVCSCMSPHAADRPRNMAEIVGVLAPWQG